MSLNAYASLPEIDCKTVNSEYEEDHLYTGIDDVTGEKIFVYFDNDSEHKITLQEDPNDFWSTWMYEFGNEDYYIHVDFKKGPEGQVVGATVDYTATIIEFICTQK